MRNLIFVNTRYQLEVALDVIFFEGLEDFVFLAPSELFGSFLSLDVCLQKVVLVDGLKHKKNRGFFDSRELIKNIEVKLSFLKKIPIRLWLANDDHILAQFVFVSFDVKETNLFEDGLGSYVRHKPMMLDLGPKRVLSRVKKMIFFFPYYRAFHRFGGNVVANNCYSYNDHCFPQQKVGRRVLIRRRDNEAIRSNDYFTEDCVIIVGQPLVEDGIVSELHYQRALSNAVYKVFYGKRVIYKPHPREKKGKKIPDGVSLHTESEAGLEDDIITSPSKVSVCGFYSTVLLNSVSIPNVKCVVALKPLKTNLPEQYYEVLSKVGCKVVEL